MDNEQSEQPEQQHAFLNFLVCGTCRSDFIVERRTGTIQCSNGNCPDYYRRYYWPNVVLEEMPPDEVE